MSVAISLHLLSAVIWVGGMFYAYMAMRPAVVEVIDASLRGKLWAATLKRFFNWVWLAVANILITGYWMIFGVLGGMAEVGLHVHLMHGLGWVMVLLYAHVFFAPFRRLKQAVADGNPKEGARRVGQIRQLVAINLCLGLVVIVIAAGGRYL